MNTSESSILKQLKNEKLSAVVFVQDYVQLQFNGPCLTSYVWPTIRESSNTFCRKTPGYRDALCALIGEEVSKTSEEANEQLRIHFNHGTILEVSLKESDRDGPEAAMMSDPSGKQWDVW
jgi:hypothetical protein